MTLSPHFQSIANLIFKSNFSRKIFAPQFPPWLSKFRESIKQCVSVGLLSVSRQRMAQKPLIPSLLIFAPRVTPSMGKSAVRKLLAWIVKTVLSSAWCLCPRDGCSGEHSANGPQHTGLDSVTPYNLPDLKYSSQRSCLSINIYFNTRYAQSAHGALGKHVTFTFAASDRPKITVEIKGALCCMEFALQNETQRPSVCYNLLIMFRN